MAKSPFVPVNELLERTTLQQFVTHYNFNTEIQQSGNEERIRSPFACEKCQGNGKALSVNWQSGVFISHCYHCNVRGRVTTLLFGMKYGRKPSGDKLKGKEFKDIAADIAKVATDARVAAIIASNTTLDRTGLSSPYAGEKGGLSGQPLFEKSTRVLAKLHKLTDIPLIGVGGIANAAQAYAKIQAGASAVQLYTGLVFGGLSLAATIARGLDALLEQDGHTSTAAATGIKVNDWL